MCEIITNSSSVGCCLLSINRSFHSLEKKCFFYVLRLSYRSLATTVSQLKISDFSRETFKCFEVLNFSVSATTTQLLSSGKFCKLCYDTIPVKSGSANVSFYTNNSKMPNFEL